MRGAASLQPSSSPLFAALPLVVALLGAGCGGAAGPGRPDPGGADGAGWERRIAPFPVRGPDGEPYAFPFIGGFDNPRPQLVDVDDDGDVDLFVQERSGAVIFFENTGTPLAPAFAWRTDRFQDLDVGEWYRFVDMDGDGDPDLLTEQPFSYIRYYRNDGGALVLAADTLKDTAGRPIFSDRQNIPNVTDIDCDARPDLFLGRLEGTITRYEATAEVGDSLPAFAHVTDRFENISIVAQIGSLHGANTMVFADFDGDGDPDLFWGDFFEPGLLYIENTGSCEVPDLRAPPLPFPPGDPVLTSGFNVPALADLEGDGDFDIVMGVLGGAYDPSRTAADNVYLLEAAEGGYAVRTRRWLDGIDVGSESVVAAGDVDGDGDADLLVGSKEGPGGRHGDLLLFENVGAPAAAAFRLADSLDVVSSYHLAPELADLDGDGRPDLLVGTWQDGVRIAWSRGGRFEAADSPLVRLPRGSHAVPAAGDVDGDGDLDLVVGEASGELNLFRNVGSTAEPRFELESEAWGAVDVGGRSAPAFADLDGDGRAELVVGHAGGGPVCFGLGGGEPRERPCGLPALLPFSAPRLVDLDGDGHQDVVAGNLSGGVTFHERRRPGS